MGKIKVIFGICIVWVFSSHLFSHNERLRLPAFLIRTCVAIQFNVSVMKWLFVFPVLSLNTMRTASFSIRWWSLLKKDKMHPSKYILPSFTILESMWKKYVKWFKYPNLILILKKKIFSGVFLNLVTVWEKLFCSEQNNHVICSSVPVLV